MACIYVSLNKSYYLPDWRDQALSSVFLCSLLTEVEFSLGAFPWVCYMNNWQASQETKGIGLEKEVSTGGNFTLPIYFHVGSGGLYVRYMQTTV